MNKESYKTIYTGGCGEIVEKKSRFLAALIPVYTEEEALAFIEKMKKKYWDASHNCSAYVIGRNNELAHCSDDGEPAKTAGRPMLDVLIQCGLHNVAAVVTRYFGGTLLGTGGLVRAYQAAVKEGLKNCSIIEKCYGRELSVTTDYSGIGKLQYIAGQLKIPVLSSEYTDIVTIKLFVPLPEETSFVKQIAEATNGKAVVSLGKESWYAVQNGELLLFDC